MCADRGAIRYFNLIRQVAARPQPPPSGADGQPSPPPPRVSRAPVATTATASISIGETDLWGLAPARSTGKDAGMAFDGPRLRRDLVSTILQEDGVRCVDVHDPRRGSSFRLFDYEYSVALAFDGRPLGKVIPWVRLSTGLELTEEQLMAFAERLKQLGFLASDKESTPEVAPEKTPALSTRPVVEVPQTPSPVPPQPVTLQTPLPVPLPTVPVEAPLPVPEPPAAVENDAPTPPSTLPEAPPATESRPATEELAAEPALPEAETASTETASLEALPGAEPPAAAVSTSPDRPSQDQTSLPSADATPLPVETPPAASPPEPSPVPSEPQPLAVPDTELAPVPPETQPLAVPDKAPSPSAKTPPPLAEPRSANRVSDGEAIDSTSRPYSIQGGARMSTPGPRRIVTPPPIPTPPPLVTPAPARSATVHSGPWILYALLGILTALVVGVLVVPVALSPHAPPAVRARVLVAKPAAVVRCFDGSAPVEALPSQVLSFPAGGKVIRLASPGISLRPGDVVAATDAARGVLADLARQQERLAYFEQLAQGVRDTGDDKRSNAAQAKVQISAGLVGQTQAALSRVAVVAQAAGQIEATLAILGRTVQAGAPAVRMRLAGWRASFELPRAPAAGFRKQGWCGAEIEGRPVACGLAPDGGDENHVVIELAPEAATVAGQPVRLVRARFAEAFLVPASALSRVGSTDRVLVVAPTGRAEARSVTVADRTAADAVITQGLDAGDAVIVETSQPVVAGARVRITEATRE